MLIILDTNILVQDFRLSKPTSRLFLSGFTRANARCAIPELVIDETVQKFARKVSELASKSNRAINRLNEVTGKDIAISVEMDLIEAEAAEYRKHLRQVLASHGIELLPYPKIGHRELAKKAMAKRKPFLDKGGGYRDALIWQCILDVLESGSGKVCLVSNDQRAFGKEPSLHADLINDLEQIGVPINSVELFNSLDMLNREKIKLERVEAMEHQLENESVDGFSLAAWVDENLIDMLGLDWAGAFAPFEPDHVSVSVGSFSPKGQPRVDDVLRLPSGELLVAANVDVEGEMWVSVTAESTWRYDDVREFFGEVSQEDFDAMMHNSGNVAFTLILHPDTYEVLSAEIDKVESELGGEVEYNLHPKRER